MTRAVAGIIRADMGVLMATEAEVIRGTAMSQFTVHRLLKGQLVFDLVQLEAVCSFLRMDPAEVLARARQKVAAPQ